MLKTGIPFYSGGRARRRSQRSLLARRDLSSLLLAFLEVASGYGAVVLGASRQRGHGPLERGADGFLSRRALRQPSLLERVFSDY